MNYVFVFDSEQCVVFVRLCGCLASLGGFKVFSYSCNYIMDGVRRMMNMDVLFIYLLVELFANGRINNPSMICYESYTPLSLSLH